jgi:hypothetical protein
MEATRFEFFFMGVSCGREAHNVSSISEGRR